MKSIDAELKAIVDLFTPIGAIIPIPPNNRGALQEMLQLLGYPCLTLQDVDPAAIHFFAAEFGWNLGDYGKLTDRQIYILLEQALACRGGKQKPIEWTEFRPAAKWTKLFKIERKKMTRDLTAWQAEGRAERRGRQAWRIDKRLLPART